MSNKVANLLRSLADVIEDTVEVTKEVVKEVKVIKTEVEPITNMPIKVNINGVDPLEKALKLMKRVEENDKVKAYKQKVSTQGAKLTNAFKEIERLKNEALIGLMEEERIPQEVKDNLIKILLKDKKSEDIVV